MNLLEELLFSACKHLSVGQLMDIRTNDLSMTLSQWYGKQLATKADLNMDFSNQKEVDKLNQEIKRLQTPMPYKNSKIERLEV